MKKQLSTIKHLFLGRTLRSHVIASVSDAISSPSLFWGRASRGLQNLILRRFWMRFAYQNDKRSRHQPSLTRRQRLFFLLAALAILLPMFYLVNKYASSTQATWFDDSYAYRKKITIGNSGSAISSARKVLVEVDTAALTTDKMQADCDDTRFTDINGKVLRHFIDTDSGACDTSSTDFFIELASVTTGDNIIYMYYGNPSASSGRSPEFFAPDASPTVGSGLKANWALDETSGTRYDFAHTNDLTDNATVTSATGKISNAADFEQDNSEYLNRADNTDLSTGSTDYTFAAWINAETISATTNEDLVIAKKWDADTADQEFTLRVKSGASPSIKIEVTNSTSSGGTIAAGTWYFVVASVDFLGGGLATYTVHVNDVQRISGGGTVAERDGTADFQIGGNNPVLADGKYFDGLIDNAMFWKRTLTASERSALYNGGNGMAFGVVSFTPTSGPTLASEEKTPGPVAYWKFDDGQGTTAQDTTVNNNDGTVSGATWTEESRCVSGKCLQFDGTDDYVNLNSAIFSTSNGTAPYSASAWIRTSTDGGIITQYTAADGNRFGLRVMSNKLVYWKVSSLATSSRSINDNLWHYVGFTKDTSGNIKLYIDGVLDGTGTDTNVYTNTNTAVGNFGTGVAIAPFKGFIDEPKIYPYARTAAQVKADFAKGSSAKGGGVLGAADISALSNGLVGYWKMDESSGDRTDSSGNAQTLTDTNTVTANPGKFGNAGQFTSANSEYLTINDNATLSAGDVDFTLSAWVYMDSKTAYQTFISKYHAENGTNGEYVLGYDQANDRFRFVVCKTSTCSYVVRADSLGSPSTGTWYHVVGWHDSVKDTINIQVNNGTVDSTSHTLGVNDVGSPFRIGALYSTGSTFHYMDGRIDEARVYKRVLSGTERSQLYNFAPGPVGHWKMDEKTGTSANDSSTYGNTGTLGTGSSAPTWTNGKYGAGLNFDGGDYIYAGDVLDSTFAGSGKNFTISTWIKPAATMTSNFIFSKNADSSCSPGENQRQIALSLATGSKLRFLWYGALDGSSYRGTLGSTVITDTSKWYHVTATFDSSQTADNKVSLYVDGVKETTTISHTVGTPSNIVDGTAHLGIGSRVSSSGAICDDASTKFNGNMDDVRVYNYARTQKQIIEDMLGGRSSVTSGGSNAGQVGHWKFDEGQGITANNAGFGGSTLNGTLTTMASPATATSGWTNSGKFGKGLLFDGVNDYVRITSGFTNTIKGNDIHTVSLWIKGTTFSNSPVLIAADTSNNDFFLETNSTGTQLLWGYGLGTTKYRTYTASVSSGWHHIVMAKTGSGDSGNLYLDGVLQTSYTGTLGSIPNTSLDLIIGAYAAGAFPFSGIIDEVKVYNGALTAEEVKIDYNQGSSVKFGSLSTDSTGTVAAFDAARAYCVPGDTTSCAAPVGEWKMDEGTGTSVSDTSGNGFTGTLGTGSSAPTWTTGKIGKGLNFDGTNDYASFGDSLDSTIAGAGQDFTFTTWVKPGASSLTSGFIISKLGDSGCSENQRQYYLGIGTGSKPTFTWYGLLDGNSYRIILGSTALTNTNKWYQVTVTFDSSQTADNKVSMYVDGVKETTSVEATLGSPTSIPNGTAHFGLGMRLNSSGTACGGSLFLNGQIDQTRAYDYIRTPAQIAWDYNRGGPVGWWKLDECQGPTAYDASGNANNGTITIGASGTQTLVGDCQSGTSTHAWYNGVTGKFNSSLNFDGTDDYVDGGGSSTILGLTEGTFSAWVKLANNTSAAAIGGVGKNGGATSAQWGMQYRGDTTDHIQIYSYTTDGNLTLNASSPTNTITDTNWHHIAATVDSSTLKLYVDGRLKTLSGANSTFFGDVTAPTKFTIGRHYQTVNPNYFPGQIDDVRVYNYALTATQVKTVMNDGSAVRFGPTTGSP